MTLCLALAACAASGERSAELRLFKLVLDRAAVPQHREEGPVLRQREGLGDQPEAPPEHFSIMRVIAHFI